MGLKWQLESFKKKSKEFLNAEEMKAIRISHGGSSNQRHRRSFTMTKRKLIVAAKYLPNGYFYIVLVVEDATLYSAVTVEFSFGTKVVHKDNIRFISGATPRPRLAFGERVLIEASTVGSVRGAKRYLEGKVALKLPNIKNGYRLYSIRLKNGNMVKKRRTQIIRLDGGNLDVKPSFRRLAQVFHTFFHEWSGKRPIKFSSPTRKSKLEERESQTHQEPKRINRGQQTDTPKVQRLQKGQEVIARFQDDGWFYCGKVVSELEDQTNYFDILDGTGQVERIHDNDIFVPEESIEPLKVSDWVIAPHPNYVHSYAPGKILSLFPEHVEVEFYDEIKSNVCTCGVLKISKMTYDKCVKHIEECEASILDWDAIVLDDLEPGFKLKRVHSRTDNQEFIVEDLDQENNSAMGIQKIAHIFPLKPNFHIKDNQKVQYVLAPTDESCRLYLPAKVFEMSDSSMAGYDSIRTITFQFYHGLQSTADSRKCFYLSQTYYDFAVKELSSR